MGTSGLESGLASGKWGTPTKLFGGVSLQCFPQFPPCMEPAACGCACANPSWGCFFCLCPSLSFSSSLPSRGLTGSCGAVQGSRLPSALLCRGVDGGRSSDILGCASWLPLKCLPCPLQVPPGDPGRCGMRASGRGLPSFLSAPVPSTLHPSPVPVRVTPVSLSRFPSVHVRLLTGRIQVSSGKAFSLLWGGCVDPSLPARCWA